MEARMILSDISQEMCIGMVRGIIDNNASATVHFKGNNESDEDFVELHDIQDSIQVTALIPVVFGSLREIVVNSDGKLKEKTANSKAYTSDAEANDGSDSTVVDVFKYFKKDIKGLKDEESVENYPVAFTMRILGVTEKARTFDRTVESLRKLICLSNKEIPAKPAKISEIIGKDSYNSLCRNVNKRFNDLNISADHSGLEMVKLYLSLYKD